MTKKGFTLIEIMVAVSIFVIVATIVAGALVTASQTNRKAQAIKLAIDNLSFAMESMVFNMRSGKKFNCVVDGSGLNGSNFSNFKDKTPFGQCPDDSDKKKDKKGEAVVFTISRPGTPEHNSVIAYRWVNNGSGIDKLQMYKESLNPNDWIDITSSDLEITNATFRVLDYNLSPKITIAISGVTTDVTETAFNIQTTVFGAR